MGGFEGATRLKKPTRLTEKRYVSSNNQLCKDDAYKIAQENDIVWSVE